MSLPVCDPLKPVKSGAQSALDSNLNKPDTGYSTFTMVSKTGDLVVPANVHIRFYNCAFDAFDATQGNNAFYFEQCVFNQKPLMTDVTAIAAGTVFKQGATIVRSKVELIPHEAPNTDPATKADNPTTKVYCAVNDTFRCEDHSLLKSLETVFEWLEEGFQDIADDLIRSMGILREAAMICGTLTAAVSGIVAWASKSILDLTNFSKYECMLDKFLNIPFTIINMINGCVAKMTSIAFGVIDAALSPLFSCASSIVSLFNQINSLISMVKNIPDRIAALANRCYLRIMDTPNLLAKRVAFLLDSQCKVELLLNQRIMAINGAVADVANSSKMVLRSCGVVASPSIGNLIPMIKVSTKSLVDFSRIKFISSNSAPLFVANNSKVKLHTIGTLERYGGTSAAQDAAIKVSHLSDLELHDIVKMAFDSLGLDGESSTLVLTKVQTAAIKSKVRALIEVRDCKVSIS